MAPCHPFLLGVLLVLLLMGLAGAEAGSGGSIPNAQAISPNTQRPTAMDDAGFTRLRRGEAPGYTTQAPTAGTLGAAENQALTLRQAAAYSQLLKLRLDSARALLAPDVRRAGTLAQVDPRTLLLLDAADFADAVLRQDAARYPAALAAMNARLDAVETQQKRRPTAWGATAEAEIRLHLALTQLCFQDELAGAWELRAALLHLEQAAGRWPDFVPLRKSLGLGQFLLGIVPDSYQWFLRVLGLHGDAATGLTNLSRTADEPNPFQTEARIFRALIREGYYKQEGEAQKLTAALWAREPDNLLFAYLRLAVLRRQKQPDAALRVFEARPRGLDYVPLVYLHHLAADLLLYRGDYAASARENEFFLVHYAGRHYRKDAAYKLYLAAWLRHDPPAAQRWLREIDQTGANVIEEDRAAQKFYDERPPFQENLLRARLAADGGYWRLAQRQLNAFPLASTINPELRAEWCYRQAKVYQGQQKTDSARVFFQRTVAVQGDAPRYFAPNAALQLGYLARQANDRPAARRWFERALAYPVHEYKRSIDSQAKAALGGL